MEKKTQCDYVLEYLEENGSITQLEALQELGIMRLASRISDLKRAGYNIHTELVTVTTRRGKSSVARYSLEA